VGVSVGMCVCVSVVEPHRSFVLSTVPVLVFARMRALKFLVQHFSVFFIFLLFFAAAPAGAFILYVCVLLLKCHTHTCSHRRS